RSGPNGTPQKPVDRDGPRAARPETVQVLGSEWGRHWGAVHCVAYHPKKPLAASGGADHLIHLWNSETLREEGVLAGHAAPVGCLAFSPSGAQLISGGEDNTLRLWDLRQRRQIRKFSGNNGAVSAVAFSPDGRLVLAGSASGTALLFDVP